MLDSDKKQLRLLQEMYLQDGDLHSDGAGRARRFRWRNVGLYLTQPQAPHTASSTSYSLRHLIQPQAPHTLLTRRNMSVCTSHSLRHLTQPQAPHTASGTSYSLRHLIHSSHGDTCRSVLHTASGTSYSLGHLIQPQAPHTLLTWRYVSVCTSYSLARPHTSVTQLDTASL